MDKDYKNGKTERKWQNSKLHYEQKVKQGVNKSKLNLSEWQKEENVEGMVNPSAENGLGFRLLKTCK